ncbi:MAG: zinc ribbon domain-containing protein [Eubacterium sp.]|nr:zinc ribbon domain-containing protein [Eubacterium sp.]
MKICPKCSKEIGDHVAFCPYCGANTQESAAPQQPPQAPPVQQGFIPPQPPQAQPQPQQNFVPPQPQQAQPQQGFVPPQQNIPPQQNFMQNQPPFVAAPVEEKASIGLAILSFFIPIVGLILFLTKKDERPKTAKACGLAAIIGFAIGLILSIVGSIAARSISKHVGSDMAEEFKKYGMEDSTEFDWGSLDDETTKDEEETTESTADMKPEDFCGKVEGNTYTNDYFGMKYELSSEYTFSSYEDIASSTSSKVEDGNAIPSMSQQGNTIFYDSMAVSSDDGSNIMTLIYPDGSGLDVASEEKVLEYMTEGIKSAYGDATVGTTYSDFVGGNLVTAVDIEFNVSDYKYYAKYIAFKKGDSFFITQVMSKDKDKVSVFYNCFTY